MIEGAKLYLPADVDNDGEEETGVFDLSNGIEISPSIRTGDLIGPTGSQVSALVDVFTGGDEGRSGWRLDAGGGAFVVEVAFQSFEGRASPWGDGSGNSMADAPGGSVFEQMSLLFRYLNQGTFDSQQPAVLEWGKYEPEDDYPALEVAVEEPRANFTSDEETSVFDGSITLVSTRSIGKAAFSQQQDEA